MTFKKIGYELTKGAIQAFCYFGLFIILAQLVVNYFNVGIDPTDRDGFHRSGLHYYKDYGTGKEYISNGNGNLILR